MAAINGTLSSGSYFDTVCHAFSCCSHQEQILLLEKLPEYLKRDFLNLLPLELGVKVVSYLEPEDVLRKCLLVSKRWYLLLTTSCESYWKAQCLKHGIIAEKLSNERAKVESFMALAVSALKFEHRLTLKSNTVVVKSLLISEGFTMPAVPTSNGYYYQQSASNSSLSIFKVDPHNCSLGTVCATVPNPFPDGHLEILWSFSRSCSVVMYCNNGKWLKFSFKELGPHLFEEWQDDVIYNTITYRSAVCCECGRIIVMSTIMNTDSSWEFQVIHVCSGDATPTKSTMSFSFMPDPLYKQEPFFTVKQVEVLPQSCSADGSHLLLVQFGYVVVGFTFTTKFNQYKVSSGLLKVFAAACNNSRACIEFTSNRLTLSADRSLMALISSDPLHLYVWNIEKHSEHRVSIDHLATSSYPLVEVKVQCLAVGHLFSLLSCDFSSTHSIFVISTYTGRTIRRCLLNPIPGLDVSVKLYAPRDQQWLNTLTPLLDKECELCVYVCANIIDSSRSLPGATFVFSL